ADICSARRRGLLVSLNQLAIVTGILLSYSVNYLLTDVGTANWRWMFASAAVPSVGFLLTLLFIPESPRWLVQKGRESEAQQFLSRIVGTRAAVDEIQSIKSAVSQQRRDLLYPPLTT